MGTLRMIYFDTHGLDLTKNSSRSHEVCLGTPLALTAGYKCGNGLLWSRLSDLKSSLIVWKECDGYHWALLRSRLGY
jgi:hypothetical protein